MEGSAVEEDIFATDVPDRYWVVGADVTPRDDSKWNSRMRKVALSLRYVVLNAYRIRDELSPPLPINTEDEEAEMPFPEQFSDGTIVLQGPALDATGEAMVREWRSEVEPHKDEAMIMTRGIVLKKLCEQVIAIREGRM